MQFWRGAEGNNLSFLELLLSLFCRCEVNEKWMVGGSVQLGNPARSQSGDDIHLFYWLVSLGSHWKGTVN